MAKPRTVAALRAIEPAVDRVAAARVFIADREAEAREARKVRNEAVRALVAEYGPAETSRMTGIPLPTVKGIGGGA